MLICPWHANAGGDDEYENEGDKKLQNTYNVSRSRVSPNRENRKFQNIAKKPIVCKT